MVADLERLGLQAQPFGAQLHDAVGAEGVSHPQLADGQQPQRRVGLQLHRGDQDGLVARVHAAGSEETTQPPVLPTQRSTQTPESLSGRRRLHLRRAIVVQGWGCETRTCRDTRGRSPGRSRGPGRWPPLWTDTARIAASPTCRRPPLHCGSSGEREATQTDEEQSGQLALLLGSPVCPPLLHFLLE